MSRKHATERLKRLEQAVRPLDHKFVAVPPWITEKGVAAVAAWLREGKTWEPVYLPPVRTEWLDTPRERPPKRAATET